MSSNFMLLDHKFWTNFTKNIWEKKPVTIKNVKSPLLEIGEAEIFRLLVLFSDQCRKLDDAAGFKFYVNGLQAHAEDILQVLPLKQDKNLLGYHKRMNALFSDYCLVCDELLKANVDKQALLTDFTTELYRHTGFPNRFSEMGLYLGNYRKTPFGVHVDSCGVFSFPVAGQKKFRLWTSAFAEKHPDLDRSFSYAKYKKDSVLMTAEVGDMTYWPSSAWHIAESDGQFSATWSLGVWVDKQHKELFSDSLNLLLSEKFGASGQLTSTAFQSLHSASGEVSDLPKAFAKSIEQLQALTTAEIQENFLKSWMLHISRQGFKNIPKVVSKLRPGSLIGLRSDRAKILWQNSLTQKTKVFCSFGGVLVETQKKSGLLKLIKALNAGQTCLVSDYIRPVAKTDLKSLHLLAEAGAFA